MLAKTDTTNTRSEAEYRSMGDALLAVASASPNVARNIAASLAALAAQAGDAGTYIAGLIAQAERYAGEVVESDVQNASAAAIPPQTEFERDMRQFMSSSEQKAYDALQPDKTYQLATVDEHGKATGDTAKTVTGSALRDALATAKYHTLNKTDQQRVHGDPHKDLGHLRESLKKLEGHKAHELGDNAHEIHANHQLFKKAHAQIDALERGPEANKEHAAVMLKDTLQEDILGKVIAPPPANSQAQDVSMEQSGRFNASMFAAQRPANNKIAL